ncbi:MAG: mechanosensitive ion channel domain-containing protein [Geminicoccaceae bacterium]
MARAGKGWRYLAIAATALVLAWILPTAPHAQTDDPGKDVDAGLQALLDVLQDDQARAELIEKLTALTEEDEQPAKVAPLSLARQAANATRSAVEEASGFASRIWRDVSEIGGGDVDLGQLTTAHLPLIGVIAATFAILMILRILRRPLFRRMAVHAEKSSVIGDLLWLIGTVLIDAVAVLLAFTGGHALALGIFGEAGRIGVDQSLFLNGFLAVELVKTVLRGATSPGSAALRFLPIGDLAASFAYRRGSAIASTIGYGVLVAAPIATLWISSAFGRAVAVLAMAAALVLALFGIWRLKSLLDEDVAATPGKADLTGRALSVVDRIWPWLASLYAITAFAIAVVRAEEGLYYILEATARSALAIILGVALVTLIGRVIKKEVPLPASLRSDMPQLGRRLDGVVPTFLKGSRLVVLIAVTLAIVDAWDLVDVGGWLTSSSGEALFNGVVSALLIGVIAYLLWLAFMSWVEYRLSGSYGRLAGARERTLLSLFGNAITIVVITIAVMLALSELGVNIGPLLAGAGVIGLAIGFGAQKLVQDIITGVFIQFENAINTGDVVTVAGTTGTVERLSVRSIGIRDVAGTYHLIPFSTVDQVANFNRGFAYHVAEIGIAYKESVAEAKEAMVAAFERLKEGELGPHLLDDLDMQGVHALGDSAVVVRARLRTAPGEQWAVGRAYNEVVKEVFDERGIDIPFPHLTVYAGTDKEGKTQIDSLLPAPG